MAEFTVIDAFTQSLKYNEAISGVTAQYNGNIERQEWTGSKYYNYVYDGLNRLTSAIASTGNNEELSYDKMGNILTLQRKLTSTFVDQLSYTYATGGNQLSSIADANANSSAEYQLPGTTSYNYDGNGSMTARTNSGSTGNNISAITYNHMGLPKTMTTGGNTLTYTYDASGRKLRKVFGAVSNSDYISGIHYEGGTFQFMQTAEGRVTRNGTATDAAYLYEYTLEDHLGNGRVYFDINAGSARKIQEEEYYAFGKAVQIGSFLGSENRYQYNGKEKQDELKMMDYGARFYDPIIGRWNVIDPLAEKYLAISTYSYVANNPLKFIDPDGKKIVDPKGRVAVTIDSKGKFQYTKYATSDVKSAVALMSATKIGSKVASGMINAKHDITIKFDKDTRPTYMNAESKISHVEKDGYNLVAGATKTTPNDNGKEFSKAEVTIYKGSIDFAMKEGYVSRIAGKEVEFGTKSNAANTGATLVHEGTHAIDKSSNSSFSKGDVEKLPKQNEAKHYDELEIKK